MAFVAKFMGDHLQQSGPSMEPIDGPVKPFMATKSAIDGPAGPVVVGDHLRRDSATTHGLACCWAEAGSYQGDPQLLKI